jgi:hypothetical protein
MAPRDKRDLDHAKKCLLRAIESIRAAQQSLREQHMNDTADELGDFTRRLDVYVRDKGLLYYLEHGEDW